MLTGPGINWWSWGAESVVPPAPSDHNNARTSDSGQSGGGDIGLRIWPFIILIGELIYVCLG